MTTTTATVVTGNLYHLADRDDHNEVYIIYITAANGEGDGIHVANMLGTFNRETRQSIRNTVETDWIVTDDDLAELAIS